MPDNLDAQITKPSPTAPDATAAQSPGKDGAGADPKQPTAERLAAARREQANLHKERQFKEEKARLEAELQKAKQDLSENYIPKGRFKEDPLWAFKEGLTNYDDVYQAMQNEGTVGADPAMMAMKREMQALKQSNERLEAQWKSASEERETHTKKQVLFEAANFLKTNPQYEALGTLGEEAPQAVLDYIQAELDTTGIMVDYSEAAQKLDDYYVEEGLKYARLKKVQEKLANPGSDGSGTTADLTRQALAPHAAQSFQDALKAAVEKNKLKPRRSVTLTRGNTTTQQPAERPLTAEQRALAAFKKLQGQS